LLGELVVQRKEVSVEEREIVPLLTLQPDIIRKAELAVSGDSFFASHAKTTPLQSLTKSIPAFPLPAKPFPKKPLPPPCTEIFIAASIMAGPQAGRQHSFNGSTLLHASNSLLTLTSFSNELTSFTGHIVLVRFEDATVHKCDILELAPLEAKILIISEKQSFANRLFKTKLSVFKPLVYEDWKICMSEFTWGQQITSPTKAASGTEQSEAVFSMIGEI
jgi:hypothetical protein